MNTVVTSAPDAAQATRRPILIVRGLAGIATALAAWGLASAIASGAPVVIALCAALVIAWSFAGALVSKRVARLGLLLAALAVVGGMGVLAASLLSSGEPTSAAHAVRAIAVGMLPGAGLHLLLAMPNGYLKTRARQMVALLGYVGAAAVAVMLWTNRPDVPSWPVITSGIVAALIGVPAMLSRGARATPGERRRMKWLSWGGVVVIGLTAVGLTFNAFIDWPSNLREIVLAATAIIPAALALSTFERLDPVIDRLLSATVSAAGVTGLVAGVYLAFVLGLGRVPEKDERTLLVLSMVAAAVVALLYVPTRSRLTAFANRFVYGERSAPDDVIRSFGSRLSRAVPMDELLLQMAESLRKTMVLDAVEVWTGGHGSLERMVSDPDRGSARVRLSGSEQPVVARAGVSGPAWMKVWLPQMLAGHDSPHVRIAPVTHSGELLGIILVERSADNRPLTQDDERTLTELARQVGLALHNVQLDSALQASLDEVRRQAAALQASRGRIVAVADAERRRIERNLHDGAQQHLVALAVKVRLARQFADADPVQAKKILEELGQDVTDTLQELRSLAHGIYPPLLADRGLAEALAAAGMRSPLSTTVAADGIGRYPQEIEAAVYFCTLEALQNAAKYAGEGATATVRVWEEAGALLFEVTDNGAGFDPKTQSLGAGFTNMSDRLGAMGGSLRVESAPGRGTKVAGTIPLPE